MKRRHHFPAAEKRKLKRKIRRRHRFLRVGMHAFDCRGLPGIIIESYYHPRDPYGADIVVKSLVDEVEGGCSIFHCAPWAVSKDYAHRYAAYVIKHGIKMACLHFSPGGYAEWAEHYRNPEPDDEYARNAKDEQDYLGLNDVEYEAFKTGVTPEE